MTAPSGMVLLCDHLPWDDTRWSTTLFMTEAEQVAALQAAGFLDVAVALAVKHLFVYQGRRRR